MDHATFFRDLQIGDRLIIGAINERSELLNLRTEEGLRLGKFPGARDRQAAAWHAFVEGLNVGLSWLAEPKHLSLSGYVTHEGLPLPPGKNDWLPETYRFHYARCFQLQVENDNLLDYPEDAIHELYQVLHGPAPSRT